MDVKLTNKVLNFTHCENIWNRINADYISHYFRRWWTQIETEERFLHFWLATGLKFKIDFNLEREGRGGIHQNENVGLYPLRSAHTRSAANTRLCNQLQWNPPQCAKFSKLFLTNPNIEMQQIRNPVCAIFTKIQICISGRQICKVEWRKVFSSTSTEKWHYQALLF